MNLLDRIFGVETMARIRVEAARQAQARAALVRPPERQPRAGGPSAQIAPAAAAARGDAPRRVEALPPRVAGGFDDALPADFPTSILGTAVIETPPLLAAFASREALLSAIVFSEALAPPIGLR